MMPGFHVGGLLMHRQSEAIMQVADLGYRCVAIRPRPESLDPSDSQFSQQVVRMAAAIRRAGVSVVIDADAMYMHDPLTPEMPALASGDPQEADLAVAWAQGWIDVAGELGAGLITLCSGRSEAGPGSEAAEESLERLSHRLDGLLQAAIQGNVELALRPRSKDVIATVAQFERLQHWLDQRDRLRLAADIGEMLLGHELPVGDRLARNIDMLGCVYLCDHRPGLVGDQRIGHGDVAVSRIASTLAGQGFGGPVIVRVDGHSEYGIQLARESRDIFDELA